MNPISFKYKKHPGDLFRSTDVIQLSNPDENLEDFLVCFLHNYQSDERVTYFNDLFKLLNNEFIDDIEKEKFIKFCGFKKQKEIKEEIKLVEKELKNEAYKNFFNLVLYNKIELIINDEKH